MYGTCFPTKVENCGKDRITCWDSVQFGKGNLSIGLFSEYGFFQAFFSSCGQMERFSNYAMPLTNSRMRETSSFSAARIFKHVFFHLRAFLFLFIDIIIK
jgi:hypothetical protein